MSVKYVYRIKRHAWILHLGGFALFFNLAAPAWPNPGKSNGLAESLQKESVAGRESSDVRALISKGIYWYERYRFDLAGQAFSKALLLNPGNAEVLKWQGLTDLAKGEVLTAGI